MIIQTINPATEVAGQEYATLSTDEAELAVTAGHQAFLHWKQSTFKQRSQLMSRLATLLKARADEFALLIAREMGKPIKQGRAEVEKCAWVCQHYAEQAEAYLQPRVIDAHLSKTMVCYQPLGLVFAIMPWNFPFWQVFRFLAPTLMAGNTVLLKHAPICTGTGNAIAQLLLDAGFPEHVFQHVILSNDGAAQVIAHPHVVALSFTGSGKTGALVGSLAAAHLKKSVLELGGNDPYLVLADADLDLAATSIVTSRLSNCGQVCIAAKRIIAVHSIYQTLLDKIMQRMSDYHMGDPEDASTNLGPMARSDLRDQLHKQVLASVEKKATLVVGGTIPDRKGFYYPPTLLTGVEPGMPAFDEELFGPVISLCQARDQEQAIALANQSVYGLSSAVFTRDVALGESVAERLNTGTCFVNAMVASDPRVPFGGIRQSGFGRELSREGILEFVNTKTIAIR